MLAHIFKFRPFAADEAENILRSGGIEGMEPKKKDALVFSTRKIPADEAENILWSGGIEGMGPKKKALSCSLREKSPKSPQLLGG